MLGEMFLRGAAVRGLKQETLIGVFDWIHDTSNDDDGRKKEWRMRKYKKFFLLLVLKSYCS
jgi:hypothetical protein